MTIHDRIMKMAVLSKALLADIIDSLSNRFIEGDIPWQKCQTW